jgi:hypothetical protein
LGEGSEATLRIGFKRVGLLQRMAAAGGTSFLPETWGAYSD